jgi:sugar O-acyltransferase (sialic acid O-acetyltransferase NeuD family)
MTDNKQVNIMSDNKQIYIFGTGGHAKIVAATCALLGWQIKAFFDADPAKAGTSFCGKPVLSQQEAASVLERESANAHLAIGSNHARHKLTLLFGKLARWPTLVHPAAIIDPAAQLGEGVFVGARAVVQVDAKVGAHCIINTGAIVEHDCQIADYVHIAPSSTLTGTVRVGSQSMIGAGAVIIPGLSVGSGTTIGAGAVLTRSCGDDLVMVGVPAQPLVKPDKKQVALR